MKMSKEAATDCARRAERSRIIEFMQKLASESHPDSLEQFMARWAIRTIKEMPE